MIRFACPSCGNIFSVSDKQAGHKFPCDHCGQRLQVPMPSVPVELLPVVRASRKPIWVLGGTLVACSVAILWILLLRDGNPTDKPGDLTAPLVSPSDDADANGPPLAAKALTILKTNCYRCHGESGTAEGGFNFVLDRDRMVARRMIRPGLPEKSRFIRRIEEGEMPPENEKPRPTPEDAHVLKQWVEQGAPSFNEPIPSKEHTSNLNVLAGIHRDVQALPERDRRFARYFTLTHLRDVGLRDDELQTYRNALAKLANSLSWHRVIKIPVGIDREKTILRIDIRDYQWNDRVWKRILADYPYGIILDDPIARQLLDIAGGQLSYLRGDWFLATVSRPPLYHEVLQLPDNERKLEEQLHIDIAENIKQEKVVRAGFNGSGVSRNNRLIERHESPYGSYWRSYDFASNSGQCNLFAHPLGPIAAGEPFRADGGEIIFSLPNGLHAFMLLGATGQRLDKAPSSIVSDPKRPDRAVENGISCMSCHARGLIAKQDQIRAHLEKSLAAFSEQETNTVKALYAPAPVLADLFKKDNDHFREAVERTGSKFTATESVTALVSAYEREVDLGTAAAEVGMTSNAFSERLAKSAVLMRRLGALRVSNGTVQRQVFAEEFSELVRELGLGVHLIPGK